MRSFVAAAVLALTAFATGCASAPADDAASSTANIETPPSGDSSDMQCRIVLRSAQRRSGTEGPVDIEGGQFVWDVAVDMSDELLAKGADAKLHLENDDGSWTDLGGAIDWENSTNGFVRVNFSFRDLSPESSNINVSGSVVFVPFAQLSNGRLFDHNATSDNVVLSSANGFRATSAACN